MAAPGPASRAIQPRFADVTAQAGIRFQHFTGAERQIDPAERLHAGIGFVDPVHVEQRLLCQNRKRTARREGHAAFTKEDADGRRHVRGSHCIMVEWWYNYPAPGNFVKRNLEDLP